MTIRNAAFNKGGAKRVGMRWSNRQIVKWLNRPKTPPDPVKAPSVIRYVRPETPEVVLRSASRSLRRPSPPMRGSFTVATVLDDGVIVHRSDRPAPRFEDKFSLAAWLLCDAGVDVILAAALASELRDGTSTIYRSEIVEWFESRQ